MAASAVLHKDRSRKARDKTASMLNMDVRSFWHDSVEKEILEFLCVKNKGDVARGREGKFYDNDPGKPKAWGLPTGGSESQEFIDDVAKREAKDESGFYVDYIYKNFLEFKLDKKTRGKEDVHPHFIYWGKADRYYQIQIKETSEIEKADWFSLAVILDKVRLGAIAWAEQRINPEAFYLSHVRDYILPILLKIDQMTLKDIENLGDPQYRGAVKLYQPHIRQALNENWDAITDLELWDRCMELGLTKYSDDDDNV